MREDKTVVLPVEILDDQNLSPVDFYILAQILRRKDSYGLITAANLKAVLKLSENTIRAGLITLAENGYLTKGPGRGTWLLNLKICGAEPQNLRYETSIPQHLKICGKEERTKEEYINNTISDFEKKKDKENDKENGKEKEIKKKEKPEEPGEKPKRRRTPFVKPTVEEVHAYCRERQSTVRAEAFVDFYESKGWMVGKSPMKDWKAAVRTWEQKDKENGRFFVPVENRQGTEDDLPY